MNTYTRYIRVADVCIKMVSSYQFDLEKDCKIFEVKCPKSVEDVTFFLEKVHDVTLESCIKLNQYASDEITIFKDNEYIYRVAYTDSAKKEIKWCLKYMDVSKPSEYTLMYREIWTQSIFQFNPLFLAGLPEFFSNYECMMLHASVIENEDRGIVFTAPSGTGKSTQADLWVKYRDAEIINGDRALIRKCKDEYRVYGSPYAGSSYIYKDKNTKLELIVILRQGSENRILHLSQKEKYLHLLSELRLSRGNKEAMNKQTDWLLELIESVPIIMFECKPDKEAVNMIYDYLKENR